MIDTSKLAFNHNRLDRGANLRGDAAWIAAHFASPRLRTVRIAGDKTVFRNGGLDLGPCEAAERVFLGVDGDGHPWCACRTAETEDLRDIRSLALEAALPPEQLGLLAQARSLIHWHERHGFCANCGAATAMQEAGYRRHCPTCSSEHFPRTDPVIIIAVTRPGYMLLGRQASWAPGMFSTLAGFIEPGETIEDAARREVFEESGVRLGDVSYVASQPWPFPASLMIGLRGTALTEAITIDPKEIEEARWFPLEEVRLMASHSHPQGLYASRPMAIAHLLISSSLQES
jgi:NAD+ diphosphatase